MIRAVTFDFWNTLYVEDPAALERRRRRRVAVAQGFFAAAGRRMESARIREALEAATARISDRRAAEQSCPDHAEVGSIIAAALHCRLSYDDAKLLAEAVSSVGRDNPPAPADGAGTLLSALRSKVGLGVVSDTGLTFGMHLEQAMAAHGLAGFFDCLTWSDRTLTTKPARRQFLHTLHRLDAAPAEAVHVGDLEDADIGGAHDAGMRAIRLAPDGTRTAADATAKTLLDVAAALRKWGVDL